MLRFSPPNPIRIISVAVVLACCATLRGQGAPPTSRPVAVPPTGVSERVTVPEESDALRREVMENLLNLPAGPGRVADFNLPREFLGRVADRILVAAFEEQFRKVVADGPASQPARPQATSRPTSRSASEAGVRVTQTRLTTERQALWRSWLEGYPSQLGFRVPLTLSGDSGGRPLDPAKIDLPFRPTLPGWRMCSESGESEIEGLHLQLSRGDDWLAPGDGGCMDVASQLAAALPRARIVASIEQKHLANFLNEAADWKSRRTGEMWALVSPMPVAQWAQDNCKFGWVESDKAAARTRVALVPRYPSRGEAGAVFIPGEAAVLQGLAECGVTRVVQSPLLFQAGNLICVWDAAKKQRVLLIGEAEIYRNVALGLSRAQVEEAFCIEFGVDKCVVLPAASFHIDYEISVRNVNGRTIALVNHEQAAAKLVLQCGVDALVRAGEFKDEDALKTKRLIEADDFKALEPLGPIFERAGPSPSQIGLSFAEKFGRGQADSGVGNLFCFLKAMDLWVLTRMTHLDFTEDPNGVAMNASFQAMRRHGADRLALQTIIKSLGWEVVAIPSMGDSKRALNYLNGIHDKTRFFMPAYGGTFEKVDQAAQAAVRKAFGPSVEIVPIRCAESQRREGAVRCSAAVMYEAPQP